MALDNANFIAELSITDPPGTDPLSQGDDQIRTIKRATFQSFPLVAAAVNITDVQMNLMAIKNEANVFTADQTINSDVIILPDANTTQRHLKFQKEGGLDAWTFARQASTVTSDFVFQRFDGLGAFVEVTARINFTDGVWDFTHVPTVQGAPLWVAGEIRLFVAATAPGTNWFVANGANGTVNLADRWLVGSGTDSAATFLTANLDATAAAGTTGSTALTEAQIAAHTHRIWSGGAANGITDVTFATLDTVTGANRGNTSKIYRDTTASGAQIIEAAGSGSGHTHTSPAQNVDVISSTRQSVRPQSYVVEYHQYVP